ncbi:MAG: hypothetical protein SGI73_19030 [Chloroflexota bacterium]|nr:hypothetical protein [Chloroflexota bacterium]
MQTYVFHVSIKGITKLWRKIELRGDQTLETLHLAIQYAFAFDNDHMYSFFMSGKRWDRLTEFSVPEHAFNGGLPIIDDEILREMESDPIMGSMATLVRQLKEQVDSAPDENEALLTPEMAEEAYKQSMKQYLEYQAQMYGMPVETLLRLVQDLMTLQLPMFVPPDAPIISKQDYAARLEQVAQENNIPVGLARHAAEQTAEMFIDEDERDVRVVRLDALRLTVGQKFLYLFDYGDEWQFNLRVHAINEAVPDIEYPRVVKSAGEPPPQYRDYDDSDDDEDDFILYIIPNDQP